jgi:hypothetical protein
MAKFADAATLREESKNMIARIKAGALGETAPQ